MRIDHVALWVDDLERMRSFYVERLGGTSGARYENPRTGFHSYFVRFAGGARIELMSAGRSATRPGGDGAVPPRTQGYSHVAFVVGARSAVDEAVARLEAIGVPIRGRPRVTGDGYYEAVIEDPEGNSVELVAEAAAVS
jgi:lactoylglutathione lyase